MTQKNPYEEHYKRGRSLKLLREELINDYQARWNHFDLLKPNDYGDVIHAVDAFKSILEIEELILKFNEHPSTDHLIEMNKILPSKRAYT